MSRANILKSAIKRIWRGTNKYAVRSIPLSMLGGVGRTVRTVRFGNGEGQWDIPDGQVDSKWICYLIGIGRNASFDEELASRVGCTVISLDPTPSSIEYVKSLEPINFRFLPWAIWVHDGHLDFYSQDLDNKVNLSAVDSGRGEQLCRVECLRLKTMMERLEHSRIDLLKIDIEGGWLPVIKDIVECGISPRVFCVEFDSPTSIGRVRCAVQLLSRIGLRLVHRRRDNYLFVHDSILDQK